MPLYNTHDLYYSYVGAQQVPRELGTKSLCMSKSCIVWVKVCETPRVKRGSQQLAYRLKLPEHWKIHDVFHISLLRPWNQSVFTVSQQQDVPELETEGQRYYETEKILRWRKVKRGNRWKREYLVMWKDRPIDEISWVPEENFPDKKSLEADLEHDQPEEESTLEV